MWYREDYPSFENSADCKYQIAFYGAQHPIYKSVSIAYHELGTEWLSFTICLKDSEAYKKLAVSLNGEYKISTIEENIEISSNEFTYAGRISFKLKTLTAKEALKVFSCINQVISTELDIEQIQKATSDILEKTKNHNHNVWGQSNNLFAASEELENKNKVSKDEPTESNGCVLI